MGRSNHEHQLKHQSNQHHEHVGKTRTRQTTTRTTGDDKTQRGETTEDNKKTEGKEKNKKPTTNTETQKATSHKTK